MTFLKHFFVLALTVSVIFLAGCEDDDENPVDPGPTGPIVLTGTITENMTLTADNEYLLRGGVFIGLENDANKTTTLTIEAGTTIYGESSSDGMLVIRRGGKIMANGTADKPIIMTSDKAVGSRGRGDWGGLIINGWAPVHDGEAVGEGGTGTYGGTVANDNSGVLRYVRVEFAGREISPDNELNGIALQGVGSGTIIEHVQVHMNQDDGIEFFGGTVNTKWVYISGCDDDMFDWTQGWTGKNQFWVAQVYGDANDSGNGFECDNNGENNAATPRTMPTIYNVTLVGDRALNGGTGKSTDGFLLREGTGAKIYNAIVQGFQYGIDVDHAETFNFAWDAANNRLNGNLVVNNSIFFGNDADTHTGDADEAGFPFTTDSFVRTLNANNRFVDPGLTAATNKTAPNFTPTANSIARTGFAQPPADGFFSQVDYVGGVDPDSNWLAGWTTAAQN